MKNKKNKKKILKGTPSLQCSGRSDEVARLTEADSLLKSLIDKKSEMAHLEEALLESIKRFRDLFEQSPIGIGIHDAKGELLMVNKAYLGIFGLSSFSLVTNHKLFSDFSLSKKNISALKSGQIVQYEAEYNFDEVKFATNKEGREYVLFTVSPLFREEKIIGYMAQLEDITERKRIAEAQRLAQMGRLLSDMAHEVNNPLMVIAGRAELALMTSVKDKDEETKNALNIILEQCFLAKDVVQRLLKYSRLGKVEKKPIEIDKTVDMIGNILSHHFRMSDIIFEKKAETKLPLCIGNEKQLQEVFMNMFQNSIDAMPGGGKISVDLSEEKGFIRIDIADTGQGMPQKVLDKIFEPFFTTKQNGTGLGMAVCYSIIKEHGGDILYKSTVGKGTTATILLPAESSVG